MDSFDDIQCEDVYDENYIMDNDYDDDVEFESDYVSYDDLVDFGTVNFEDY